jgi:hypothetical protein
MSRADRSDRFQSLAAMRFAVAAMGLLITGACAGHYGSSTFPVNFQPQPNDKRPVYLIPDQVWTEYRPSFEPSADDPQHLELNERLLQYRVHDDGTMDVDTITYDVVVWNPDQSQLIAIDKITPDTPQQTFQVPFDRASYSNP